MKIKPLVWSEPAPPNEDVSYDHTIAETPFGRIVIAWKGWKAFDSRDAIETPWEGYGGSFLDLDEAKQAMQLKFEQLINECLEKES
jgi:hypothetical protein